MRSARSWVAGLMLLGAMVGYSPAGEFKPSAGWVQLFNGRDLSGWKKVGRYPSDWRIKDGVLFSPTASDNIYTEKTFEDFAIHLEFRIKKAGNSGVFLRGRKEVQIYDSHGKAKLDNTECGAVFGKVAPSVNACKPAGEWNTLDVTMVGRKVTVVLNGKTVVDGKVINGVTGWGLDNNEDKPGPIMLQGDHTPVWFRNIWLKPLPK